MAKATNGQEAVALLAASVPDTYDVVLMDLQMPVMGGLEASRRIRELESADAKTLPILAMTAQGSEGTAQQCKDAGMCGYILKPIEPHDLIGQILRHRKTIVFRKKKQVISPVFSFVKGIRFNANPVDFLKKSV